MSERAQSAKKERAALTAQLRSAGKTWAEIAEIFRQCYDVNARVALRMAHGFSQTDVADIWNERWPGERPRTFKNVSSWERWPIGGHEPSMSALKHLAQIYQCSVSDLVTDWGDYRELDSARGARHAENESNGAPASAETRDLSPIEWDEMERRLFLQLIASAGLGSAGILNLSAAGRQLFDLVVGAGPRTIEEWELACSDHLYALRTRPPATARQDLLIDLFALHRQLRTVGRDSSDLQRVAAALSTLHANLLTRLGEHGAAIRWWRTARNAADASGDLELRLGVRATEAGHGLFGQRSPETVLVLTQSAQGIIGKNPSQGHAFVLCSQAKALSTLGRHDEARSALDAYRDLISGTLCTTDIMPGYWNGAAENQLKLHAAESYIFASVGDETATCGAIERVLVSANDDYQIVPSVKLYEALCTVANGGIERGVRQASEIVDGLRPAQQDAMILERAHRILRAVPVDARALEPVRAFREVLATASETRNNAVRGIAG